MRITSPLPLPRKHPQSLQQPLTSPHRHPLHPKRPLYLTITNHIILRQLLHPQRIKRQMQPSPQLRHTIHQPPRHTPYMRRPSQRLTNHLDKLISRKRLIIRHMINTRRNIHPQNTADHKTEIPLIPRSMNHARTNNIHPLTRGHAIAIIEIMKGSCQCCRREFLYEILYQIKSYN